MSLQIGAAKSTDELVDVISERVAPLGFYGIFVGQLEPNNKIGRLSGFSSDAPTDYLCHYVKQRYDLVSPVVAKLKRASEPFKWSQVVYDKLENPLGHRCVSEAHEAGLVDAFCVPIRNHPNRLAGWMTFFSKQIDLSPTHEALLHLIGLIGHSRLTELRKEGDTPLNGVLTPREREVLKWVAMGKTSQDIAIILDIAPRTVEQYIQNSAQKLGTTNRIHTVVSAIKRGEIQI